ncbi:hypothetical protein HERIO_1010 [Hepatospora eriocheir]|uniref:Uncharacterized protein n=1 Tax=Hepatospora eriocheir TaxID=1081669 RepID=A0A1X0QBG4_9MICR|nr:hypothetical protein HERIO_1010 [Hepatospora eriocheir]
MIGKIFNLTNNNENIKKCSEITSNIISNLEVINNVFYKYKENIKNVVGINAMIENIIKGFKNIKEEIDNLGTNEDN